LRIEPTAPEDGNRVLADIAFDSVVIEWRGPAPFLFAPIPDEYSGEIRFAAQLASYGWGVVPVKARIGATDFTTSLFPRDGGYLLPLKVMVQRQECIGVGSRVRAGIRIVAQR